MIALIFLVLALICFIVAAAGYPPNAPRPNMIALGLAFWVLSVLVGSGHVLLH